MFPNKRWTDRLRNAFAGIEFEYVRTVAVRPCIPGPSETDVAQRPRKILELPAPPAHRREPAWLLMDFILMLSGGV